MKTLLRSSALALALASLPLAGPTLAQESSAEAGYDVYARFRDDPQVATERLESGLWRARLPLAAIRPEQGAIRLDGARASEDISFAVAAQADIQSARLILRHVSGRAQADAHPQLRLGLNGRFIGQVDGVTEKAAAVNEIVLDPASLKSGFNTLTIDAVQRYTYDCQDPDAAELWTDVDTARSYVEVTYARRPFAGTLADLGALITAGVGGVEDLGIVTGDGAMTADRLRWGTVASQAVANRLAYRLPRIAGFNPAGLPEAAAGYDLVAVGTLDELGSLAPAGAANLSGDESWISIAPSPADPTRFLIVASGRTPAGVEGAVRALAAADFPLSDASSVVLSGDEVPAGAVIARKRPIRAGSKYTFGDLGLAGTSLLGKEHGEIDLDFDLPADIRFRPEGEVILSLDFAYGAGLKEDSVVNVIVNGEFQRAIRLTNPDGEVTPGYQLALSPDALRPGQNRIAFEVELSSGRQGHCAGLNLRHLAFVMKDTSTLTLPEADRFVELPNLALLAESGYPYTGLDAQPFEIRAGDTGPETAAAVWTLAARLGQIHGTVFTDATYGFGLALDDAHTLVVGTRAALDGFLPAEISFSSRMTTGAQASALPGDAASFTQDYKAIDLGDNGLVIEGQSPDHAGRLVTVVTAESAGQLLDSARSLVSPSHWSQLKGGAAVWRENAATVVTQAPRVQFAIGQMEKAEQARLKSGRSPWRWILTIGAILFAFASALALIARYMRDRMNDN